MKKQKKKMNKRTVVFLVLSLVLLTALCIGLVLLCRGCGQTPNDEQVNTDQPSQQEEPGNNAPASVLEEVDVALDKGLQITGIGAYTGAYVEDGSNEFVSGVLMLRVTNNGTEAIQYAEFTIPMEDTAAKFTLSTLPAGATAILLEQSRMLWDEQTVYPAPEMSLVAMFDEPLSLREDKLKIQALDGGLNVTNISGQDIDGDIIIYYKNAQQGIFYGGITYRVRLQGGMKADEIKQIMSDHFSATGSEVVFITIS